ncbi:MAG: helix-turn-helix domain-containing protein [Longimicrobiales bacterium]
MLTALLRTPVLRSAVASAARWDEDVLVERSEVVRALRVAHPRALVVDEHHAREAAVADARGRELPVVRIRDADLDQWETRRRERVPPPARARYYGAQLRSLLPVGPPSWVDRLLADLARAAGRPLPASFRLLARRVLEDPSRYSTLETLTPVIELRSAALRARFRRRDLPSPVDYLRWLRLLAVVHRLTSSSETVGAAAMALGFQSSGNLARFARTVCGRVPSDLRADDVWPVLLIRFAASLLRPDLLERWESLDPVFVREA